MQNGALKYSNTWNRVNTVAKTRVIILLVIDSRRYPPRRAECDHVSDAPDVRRRPVFSSGISHGFLAWIPSGGQTAPINGAGFRLAWK